jgi:hypothetical protein
MKKAKGGRKAGTITRWHILQFVKPTNIVNNSTYLRINKCSHIRHEFFRLDQPIPYAEIYFRPKKTKDGLQTNGVTAIHVRSDGLNSQIGVILGAGAPLGSVWGLRKHCRYMQYYLLICKRSKRA